MKSPMEEKKKLIPLFFIFFLTICVFPASGSHSKGKQKTSGETYRRGTIKFKPVMKISVDSFPVDVLAKLLIAIVQKKNRLYVLDLRLCDIKVLNLEGKFIKTFGRKGKGPGDLLSPSYNCVSHDRLVIWEIGNRRFSYFSPGGKFIKIEKPKIKGRLENMKALGDGRIVLEIQRVEGNKEKKEIFEWRVLELYSPELRYLKTVYRQKESRYKYFINPRPHRRMILPYQPRLYWDVLPGGKLVAGFSGEYQIKIIDIDSGQVKITSRAYSPVKVTEIDKKMYLANHLNYKGGKLKRGASKFVRDNIEFPPFKPAYKKIITDYEGHILVFGYSAFDQGKSDFLANSFDVFDSNGAFVNHVKFEDNQEFHIEKVVPVSGDEFWCLETEDEFDLIFVKYKAM